MADDTTREGSSTTPGAPERRSWWSRWWKRLTVIAVVVIVFLAGASVVAARFTESNRFCGTDCHEMWPYRDSWAASTHKNVDCVKCHIPPGPVNFLLTKMYASREVWVHFTGGTNKPILVTRHIPNSSCDRSGCHTSAQIAKPLVLGTPAPVTFKHLGAGHASQLCVACHAALVHGGAPGVPAVPPQSMATCFGCHNNGTKDCSYCHAAPHANRGPCQDCHNLGAWVGGKNFTHPQPLVGTHAQIACEQCHTKGVAVKPDGCVNCHGDHHNGLRNCVDCHVLKGWIPSTFKHPQEGEHVPTGEVPLQCNACHLQGFGQPASCPCHGGKPPSGGG